MGLTGEFVKSVFSRNRISSNEITVRSNTPEKRRWRHVTSYLCGDEFNSVLAEEDSSSVKSSEATVTQPLQEEYLTQNGDTESGETVEISQKENTGLQGSTSMQETEAAMIIQTAFRDFQCRRKLGLIGSGGGSPSRESVGTSIEVLTGNSTEAFSNERDKIEFHSLLQHQAIKKKKEDWDDSTLSSNVLKLRIQNKLEAMTRRERALAYAFSQQLRICKKKPQTNCDPAEYDDIGWSWLERWMATRNPEISSMESYVKKPYDIMNMSQQRITIQKRFAEFVPGEEKESCGSNEVVVQVDDISVTSPEDNKGSSSPRKISTHNSRTVSRRKTVTNSNSIKECLKNGTRYDSSKLGKNTRKKHGQAERKRKTKAINGH